jgi:hypothetical protein
MYKCSNHLKAFATPTTKIKKAAQLFLKQKKIKK